MDTKYLGSGIAKHGYLALLVLSAVSLSYVFSVGILNANTNTNSALTHNSSILSAAIFAKPTTTISNSSNSTPTLKQLTRQIIKLTRQIGKTTNATIRQQLIMKLQQLVQLLAKLYGTNTTTTTIPTSSTLNTTVSTTVSTTLSTTSTTSVPTSISSSTSTSTSISSTSTSTSTSSTSTTTTTTIPPSGPYTIQVAQGVGYVAIHPSGTFAYVVTSTSSTPSVWPGTVNIISTATNTVVGGIVMPTLSGVTGSPTNREQLTSIAFSPNGKVAYVTGYFISGAPSQNVGNVFVINTATNAVVATISVGYVPVKAAFSPSGAFAYVLNGYNGTISIINVSTGIVIGTIPLGVNTDASGDISFNPSGTQAYASIALPSPTNIGAIDVINTATSSVVNTIKVGSTNTYINGLAFSPSGSQAYATDCCVNSHGNVIIINVASNSTSGVIGTGFGSFPLSAPTSIAINPSGTFAYTTDTDYNNVKVINLGTATTVNAVAVGNYLNGNPINLGISPSGTYAYVSESGATNGGSPDYAKGRVVVIPTNP